MEDLGVEGRKEGGGGEGGKRKWRRRTVALSAGLGKKKEKRQIENSVLLRR